MKLYTYTDEDGDKLKIEPSDIEKGAALIQAVSGPNSVLVRIPAHRLAAVVAAMYEAAGQPVPDLPVIHDDKQVADLANLMCVALEKGADVMLGLPAHRYKDAARQLLAHGVRLPEATHG